MADRKTYFLRHRFFDGRDEKYTHSLVMSKTYRIIMKIKYNYEDFTITKKTIKNIQIMLTFEKLDKYF